QVWLLDELQDLVAPCSSRADLDVAIAGFGPARRHAEDDQLSCVGRSNTVFHRLPELAVGADLMVARGCRVERVAVELHRVDGCNGNCRGRATGSRFQDQRAGAATG